MHTEKPLFVTLGYLRPLFDHFAANELPREPLLEAAGISADDLSSFDLRLPDSVIDRLYLKAEEISGDPNVGLHSGSRMLVSNIGVIGHLFLTCSSTSEALELHTRFQSLIGNGAFSRYEFGEETITLRFYRVEGQPNYCRGAYEANLAGWVNLVRKYMAEGLNSSRITFPCEAPADASEQEAYFGCPVSYSGGTGEMLVEYSREFLNISLKQADPALRVALEKAARERLLQLYGHQQDHDPFLAAVRQFIAEQIPHGVPTLEAAARHSDLSVRKFQRCLEQGNTNYKDLLDNVRRQLAEKYLADSTLSLVDVALMLGFSEQSTFQRAFKRWFATTPGEYRRAL